MAPCQWLGATIAGPFCEGTTVHAGGVRCCRWRPHGSPEPRIALLVDEGEDREAGLVLGVIALPVDSASPC
jgi:hypothetical protein